MPDIKVVCCNCGHVLREGTTDAEGRVSHGICDPCGAALYPGVWQEIKAKAEAARG